MGIILGVDIGGSTTKIVGLREDGSLLSALRVNANDQLTSLYGAVGNFLNTNRLKLQDISRIVLTGVGSSYVNQPIYGIHTEKVPEFDAIGCGGLSLSGKDNAVVVSLGTGTAFVWATPDEIRHLGGSGVGGGTLFGLCSLLTGARSMEQVEKLLEEGDLSRIDLSVGDLSREANFSLGSDVTAANFGKISEDAIPGDLALGVTNMVMQVIGTISFFATRSCGTKTVILTGTLTGMPRVKELLDPVAELYGLDIIIPDHAAYAPAIGAALFSLKGGGTVVDYPEN